MTSCSRVAVLVALALVPACYATNVVEQQPDARVCVELGSMGCLIDRPCWCHRNDGGRGWSCQECPCVSCLCRGVGGNESDACQ